MTLLEALAKAAPLHIADDHLAIRRASWLEGNRIQWLGRDRRWAFGNRFCADLLNTDPLDDAHRLDLAGMQGCLGCLTPETMLADDWEVTR